MASSIYPRRGKTGVTYEARWTDPNGKTHTQTFKKRKDAAAHLVAAAGKSYISDRSSLTVGGALDQWLTVCETSGRDGRQPVEPGTLDSYRQEANHLRALVLPDGDVTVTEIKISRLDKPLLITIRDALVAKLTRPMAKRVFDRLGAALNEAQSRGQLLTDPKRGVTGVIMSSRDHTDIVIPELHQANLLLARAHDRADTTNPQLARSGRRFELIVQVLMFAGMRPSELRGLPRKYVMPDRCLIRVRQRADETGIIGPPKSKAGNRDIVIPRFVADNLKGWLADIDADPDRLVFGTASNKPDSLANLHSRMWRPLLKLAGLGEEFNLYSLRHFFASSHIAAGANIKALQVMMGHEKVETTLNIYGHLFHDQADQQVARAEQMAASVLGAVAPATEEAGTVAVLRRAS